MIKVTCLGLYMHHLVFWNKFLSGNQSVFSKYSIVYMSLSSISSAVIMLDLLTKSAIQHRSDVRSRFSYFLYVGNDQDTLHK